MRLPNLINDPAPMLPILEALRDDEDEYVRRSVANHLSDIAKDHPDLVAGLAGDWMRRADKRRENLVRHACRTLIKQGHPAALKSLGFARFQLQLDAFSIETRTVKLGDALEFSVHLRSTSDEPQPLMIDYLVHFMKANGKLASKVFKWKRVTIRAGEVLALRRAHAIRPISTRRYYGGKHALSLRINGQDLGYAEFGLVI